MKTKFLGLLFCSLILSACTPMAATRGNLPEEYQLKEILPGIDGKDDVMRKIGSPTTISTFDDNKWYYMGQKTKKKGIMDPELTQEKIILVKFDLDGKVGAVTEQRGTREEIPIVQRTTPVSGNEYTFIQQMIGNVGKFNKQPKSAVDTSGGNSQ